jgi:hypothetical protein
MGNMFEGEIKKSNKQGIKDSKGKESVNNCLPSWREEPIKDINPYMPLEAKGIGCPKHKKGSVKIIGKIISPQGCLIKDIPHYGRVNHPQNEGDNEPGENLRHPLVKNINTL